MLKTVGSNSRARSNFQKTFICNILVLDLQVKLEPAPDDENCFS